LLEPVLADRSPAIRKEVGRALMNSVSELADDSAARGAIEIFRRSFQPTLDMPSTQTEVAQLEQALGRFDQAEEALNRALVIEPAYLPALLNLADLKRSQSDSDTAGNLLRQAVGFAPDSGAAHHSLGLYLIREKDIQMALQHLRQATERVDSLPRYSYVFAVALDSVTKTRDAIAILQAATRRWPNQFDLLMLEVLYREKVGLLNGIQSPLRALAKIAPNESAVQQRLEYYRVP
jgi:tetratricopeptide (TPR) repeat protein